MKQEFYCFKNISPKVAESDPELEQIISEACELYVKKLAEEEEKLWQNK